MDANYREYHGHKARARWPDGPWNREPDKAQWIDEATDLDCLIVRNHMGALCGYVGVTEAHPCFGKSYSGVDVEVHGGLTFADACQSMGDEQASDEAHAICHVPASGRPDHVWWFGFDCAHAWDYTPGLIEHFSLDLFTVIATMGDGDGEVYRDWAYVRGEIASLARQLKALA